MASKNGTGGYRLPKRTARIVFEDDYAGAEVVCSLGMSLEDFGDIQKARDEADGGSVEANRRFGDDVLVSWNLHDEDGKPIPATGDGFVQQPIEFVNLIAMKWAEAMTSPLSQMKKPA